MCGFPGRICELVYLAAEQKTHTTHTTHYDPRRRWCPILASVAPVGYACLMARDDGPLDLDAAERAEALATIAAGQPARVWRSGRILVLTTREDVDAVWPPRRHAVARRHREEGWWRHA